MPTTGHMLQGVQQTKIVIADDDKDILNLLCYILEREGYRVSKANNGEDALRMVEAELPDLVLLDVMMPRLNGLDVCRRIRQNPRLRSTPILILTAQSEESSEVEGLDAGADDYLPKPIAPRRLMSHVRALLRRSQQVEGSLKHTSNLLRLSGLEIDRDHYVVRHRQAVPPLTTPLPKKEFELLFFMASHPGRVFSRQDLLNEVWGTDVFVMDRTVDVHISKIREKLGEGYISTVKGVGYKFNS